MPCITNKVSSRVRLVTDRCADAEFNVAPFAEQQTPFHEKQGCQASLSERTPLDFVTSLPGATEHWLKE